MGQGSGWPSSPDRADIVRHAYSTRATEYIDLLGHIDGAAPEDQATVTLWARDCAGHVVDVGCGPGHWTAYLAEIVDSVEGVDPVPEFIDHARSSYPQVPYRVGSFGDLNEYPQPLGGVFSWYSLIHFDPDDVPDVLATIHASLAPGGRLLLAFFDGDRVEEFPHAVAPAFYWPLRTMIDTVQQAGFIVTHSQRRHDRGHRPHAALFARRN